MNDKFLKKTLAVLPNSNLNYGNFIKPDWAHGLSYTRFNDEVVELPIDASSTQIKVDFKDNSENKVLFNTNYSHTSFLILNDGLNYHAYILTTIADSTYVGNNPAKLALNTYRKLEPNFSGIVVYSSLEGNFVCSFGFKNGKLLPAITASTSAQSEKTLQNISTSIAKTLVANQTVTYSCTDYYVDVYSNNSLFATYYAYTTCTIFNSNGSTIISSTNNTPSGGTSPTPPPCPPSAASSAAFLSHASSKVAQPAPTPVGSGDGGIPPPVNSNPCVVTTSTTTTTTTTTPPKDPCAQKATINAIAANATILTQNTQIVASAANTAIEYGANQNLTTWPGSIYLNTGVTPGTGARSMPTFSWDSTNGYSIGNSHWHPGGTPPSPDDIFGMIANLTNTNNTSTNKLIAVGASALNFYRNNVSITVLTNTTNYVVTVNSWGTLSTLYAKYQASLDPNTGEYGFDNDYLKAVTENNNNYAYPLLTLFSDAINLYSAPAGSTT